MKELEGVTFQPELKTNRLPKRDGVRPEDFLLFQGQLASEKKAKLKRDVERQRAEEETFKPFINQRSKWIVAL